ncbi:hypothetical protein [Streptomyces sp. NPDC003032]
MVGATTALGLLVWVSAADLERSNQIMGVAGSVAGIAALGVALWQLRTLSGAAALSSERVRAARGSLAARGSIRNSTARDAGPESGTSAGNSDIPASGGSIAAGGDIDGSRAQHGQ